MLTNDDWGRALQRLTSAYPSHRWLRDTLTTTAWRAELERIGARPAHLNQAIDDLLERRLDSPLNISHLVHAVRQAQRAAAAAPHPSAPDDPPASTHETTLQWFLDQRTEVLNALASGLPNTPERRASLEQDLANWDADIARLSGRSYSGPGRPSYSWDDVWRLWSDTPPDAPLRSA